MERLKIKKRRRKNRMGREDPDITSPREKIEYCYECREILNYVFPGGLNFGVKIKSHWLKRRGRS